MAGLRKLRVTLMPAVAFAGIGATVLAALVAGPAEVAPQRPPSVVERVVNGVEWANLERHICLLQARSDLEYCNTQGSRHSLRPAALGEAEDYIAGQLASLGLEVAREPFVLPGENGQPSAVITNVVASMPGSGRHDGRLLWLMTAHYDSLGVRTPDWQPSDPAPGADDNGSGVASLLETARLLKTERLRDDVRFVLFAGEEQGCYGSKDHAAKARGRGESIAGVVNLDMIGYDSDAEPYFELHAGTDPRSLTAAGAITSTIADFGLGVVPQLMVGDHSARSDHESFWNEGYPAVMMIEDSNMRGPTVDWNPFYHTVDDTLDKLNRAYLTAMARAAAGGMARLARPDAPDLAVRIDGPDSAAPGSTLALVLTYENRGLADAHRVVLTDTLSSGLVFTREGAGALPLRIASSQAAWLLGDVPIGRCGQVTVTASLGPELPELAVVTSRPVIASDALDADGADNVAELRITVLYPDHVYLPSARR